MTRSNRIKKLILLLGDITLFYASLFAALLARYASAPSLKLWSLHMFPFSIIYILWIIVFYIVGLYDIEKKIFASASAAIKAMAAGGIIAILFFYLIPYFGIAPKTNLIINIFIACFLIWIWRKLFFEFLIRTAKIKVFLLNGMEEMADFAEFISKRPHLGYEIINDISGANIIVVSEQAKQKPEIIKSLYLKIRSGENITILDFGKFYESITGKIPIFLISKAWFLENLMELNKQAFEKFKRIADIILAIILFMPFALIFPFAAIAIKINSKGPIIYKQKRVGKNGKIFEIIKFRSMVADAEKNGAQWAQKKDKRVTLSGNILRKTRIDELPQIWNVFKGDLSFIGPRPERPEFVKELAEKIPHYSMRNLVKPGLSGWAQVNFPYGASVEDAIEKLQYDLYYIKNRSLALEISIALKTIMTILSREGR